MKRQDLAHLQATVEIALLRNHRDALLDLDRVALHVDPHDPTRPASRQHVGGEHPDGSGLARAIRPE
jgi:hypothetical protein